VDHVEADNFTVGLLDLSELHQEVPETRLCDDSVDRKNSHPVQLGRRVCLGGQMAANDLVFCETTHFELLAVQIYRCVVAEVSFLVLLDEAQKGQEGQR